MFKNPFGDDHHERNTHFVCHLRRPVQVSGLTEVAGIASGSWHSLAVRRDGSVWAWGRNLEGQIGDGTNTQREVPVPVSGLTVASRVLATSTCGFVSGR